MTETIETLLQPIQNRLNAANLGPLGLSMSEDRKWGLLLENPGTSDERLVAKYVDDDEAELFAASPTDQARLLAAIQAVANECGEVVADSAGLGLDFQEDDFDRGYHAARRQTVQQIVDVVVAALSEAR